MKFTTYLRNGAPRLAVVDGNDLIDLNDASRKCPPTCAQALKAGVDLQGRRRPPR
jgi:acylpyruvate hydrolase